MVQLVSYSSCAIKGLIDRVLDFSVSYEYIVELPLDKPLKERSEFLFNLISKFPRGTEIILHGVLRESELMLLMSHFRFRFSDGVLPKGCVTGLQTSLIESRNSTLTIGINELAFGYRRNTLKALGIVQEADYDDSAWDRPGSR